VAQPNANAANIASPTNNFVQNLPFTNGTDSYDVKIDYAPTEGNHVSARYSYQKVNTFQAPSFGSFLGGPAGGGFEATGNQAPTAVASL
jgi:hypothetical protein